MKSKLRRGAKVVNGVLIFFTILLGYGLLFTAAYFSHPNAEDFSLTATPKNRGIIYSITDLLVNYDGRYFTNFLHGVNPMAMGWLGGYQLTIVFSIIFSIFSLYYFLSGMDNTCKKHNIFIFSALFMLVGFALSSSLVHLVYWMVSSFVYLYSWCFWLLWMGAFVRGIKAVNTKVQHIYLLLAMVLLFFAIGINEIFLIINLATVSLAVYLIYKHKRDVFFLTLPLLGTAVVSTLFFLSNPGIINRFSNQFAQHDSFSWVNLFFKSVSEFGSEMFRLVTQSGIAFFFLLFMLSAVRKDALSAFIKPLKTAPLGLISLLVIFLSTFAFYVPMGHEEGLPARVYTSINLLTLFWFLAILLILCNRFSLAKIRGKVYLRFIGLIGLFFSLILCPNNIQNIKKELLSGEIQQHNHEMRERYTKLNSTADTTMCWNVVTLRPLNAKPRSIYHAPDVQRNREAPFWNAAYEKYFGLDEVRLEGDTVFIKHLVNQY